jgi:UDP-D-galactose:(glucosyl)LPS alpha-1,6-D-galactosyltransferase
MVEIRMKVAIIAPFLSGKGGTETVIESVLEHYKDTSIEFSLILTSDIGDKNWYLRMKESYNIELSPTENKLKKMIYLMRFALKTDADIILVLNTKLIDLLQKFKRFFHKQYKVCSWIHFSLGNEKGIEPNKIPLADYHLAISTGIKKQLMQLDVPENRIFTIFNPVSQQSETISRSDDGVFHLLFIGRVQFHHQKNLHDLFLMLEQLELPWQLDIFGSGHDYELKACESFANKLKISDKINWHGWTEKPWLEIKRTDLLLLSSNYEGFPMVLLEALSRGVACVSANCPTGTDDLINADNGALYSMGNIEEFTTKVQTVLLNLEKYPSIKVKQSIAPFYEDRYFERLSAALIKMN